ncbi:MAG: GGDEF domain-containing protein [Desulfuromonas sp.]|nr:MAG: GGDEF domain-containing protein [Desulfuromonas sp.]
MTFSKLSIYLLLPGLLFGGALYLNRQVNLPAGFEPLLTAFPAVVALAGLLLGWRFNRSRVIWAILLLILAEWLPPLLSSFASEYFTALVQVLLPFNLALIACWSERGLVTVHGLLRGALIGGQLGGCFWLYRSWPGEVIAILHRHYLPFDLPDLFHLPQLASLVAMGCLVWLLVRFWLTPDAMSGGFVWGLIAVQAGLLWPHQFSFWAGVAALILVMAIIESSFSMAFNDELTGLPARRAMNEFLLKVGRRYTLAMVDVDHFKKVNDTHGHDVGDQVLKMVAGCLRGVTGGGKPFRYGGEEFAVIFSGKELEQTLPHLERLRERISQAEFVLRGRNRPRKKPAGKVKSKSSGLLQVTASIGAAERSGDLASA